jgi:drug/metabolite transporter (DMT)-like permease
MNRWSSHLAVVGAALLFSTGGAVIKSLELSPWAVAGLRSLLAAIALGVFFPNAVRGWSLRLLPAAAAYAVTLVCFVLATKWTTAAAAIFFQSTAPIWVLLLGPWLLREPLELRDLPFLAGAGGGLLLVFLGSGERTETAPSPQLGNAVALLAGFGYALLILSFRRLSRTETQSMEPTRAALLGNLLAAALALPAAAPLDGLNVEGWIGLLYLGAVQIALAYRLLAVGVSNLPAFEVSFLLLLEPVLNPIWTAWWTGEKPSPMAMAGGAILLGTLLLRALRTRKR